MMGDKGGSYRVLLGDKREKERGKARGQGIQLETERATDVDRQREAGRRDRQYDTHRKRAREGGREGGRRRQKHTER